MEMFQMIWVIGDIHGMIGPLNRILASIQQYHEKTEKIIFIGDYVDHGLYSKEVLDTLMELDLPTVFISGNHDDLALRFFLKINLCSSMTYDEWFQQGAYRTFCSLLKGSDKKEIFEEICDKLENQRYPQWEEFNKTYPHWKYIRFLESLRYSHKETFHCNYETVTFRFFHGLPRIDQTLDEQMVNDFRDYERYKNEPFEQLWPYCLRGSDQFGELKKLGFKPVDSPEDTILWGRNPSLRFAYGGDVVVHGHTPTLLFQKRHNANLTKDFYPVLDKYPIESRLPFLFARDKDAGYIKPAGDPLNHCDWTFHTEENFAVEEINIDTGAVYVGGALTALGLSKENLKNNELVVLTTLTTPSDEPRRGITPEMEEILKPAIPEKGTVIERIIKTNKLGADIDDEVSNPLFPFDEFRSPITTG
jgi:predicted phosphodiesterase